MSVYYKIKQKASIYNVLNDLSKLHDTSSHATKLICVMVLVTRGILVSGGSTL